MSNHMKLIQSFLLHLTCVRPIGNRAMGPVVLINYFVSCSWNCEL